MAMDRLLEYILGCLVLLQLCVSVPVPSNTTVYIPFGYCDNVASQSICYKVLGSNITVSLPPREFISSNNSLSDIDVLKIFEKQITMKVEQYYEQGIDTDGSCGDAILLSVCLDVYEHCPDFIYDDYFEDAPVNCGLPCDTWRKYLSVNCNCRPGFGCREGLESVISTCPLQTSRVIFQNGQYECQSLPEDLQTRIINEVPSVQALDCGPPSEGSYCYSVFQSTSVVHTSHHIADIFAEEYYRDLVMAGGRPFINASFTECDAAIKLFSCTSVYTTCQNTSDGGGKSFNYLPFCANVTQDGIFTAARRACPCVETEDNCLLHFQVTFFNIFNRLNIDFDGKSERCQPIPKDLMRIFDPKSVTRILTCPPFVDSSGLTQRSLSVLAIVPVVIIILWVTFQ